MMCKFRSLLPFLLIGWTNGSFLSWLGMYSNICHVAQDGRVSNHIDNKFFAFRPQNKNLNSTYDEISTPYTGREVMVSAIEKGSLFWAVNLLQSVSKLLKPFEHTNAETDHPEILFIVFDNKTLDFCDSLYIPCWYPLDILHAKIELGNIKKRARRSSHLSSVRQINNFLRLSAVSHLLTAGANVFLSEADVFWLRSPFTHMLISEGAFRLVLPTPKQNNGAGIFYAQGSKGVGRFFSNVLEYCHKKKDVTRFSCVQNAINQEQVFYSGSIGYFGSHSFPSSGCKWKQMSLDEKNSAYFFFGRCKAKNAVTGHGLLPVLKYYDQEGMLGIKFLHDLLATASEYPIERKKPKRIYVGNAEEPEAWKTTQEAPVDLSMFSDTRFAFSFIEKNLLSFAHRSKNLPDFLEHVLSRNNSISE